MFYEFSQKNSGGSFDHFPKRGIGYRVIIEASNATEANNRAESIGLYFDGVEEGVDCGCCGDRWYQQWSTDKGDKVPSNYGVPVDFDKKSPTWNIPSYIHYANGEIKEFNY